MSTPTNIFDQLTRDEGVNPHAYQDHLGFWTVGRGICIDARKGGLRPEEIDYLTNNRLRLLSESLRSSFPFLVGLDDVRFSALLNMAYQMGVAGVGGFRDMLAALEARNYEAAADAMLDSLWAKEQTPARAQRLALQVRTGVRQ